VNLNKEFVLKSTALPAPAPSLVIDRSWKASIMSGRPPRYALTCRYGRPGKPTSQSEAGRSPAKRDLYTIVTSLSNALNIWLAFKRTTFNVCALCMAARTVAALIMSYQVAFKMVLDASKSPLPPFLKGAGGILNATRYQAHFFRARYYISLSYEVWKGKK
jgi:hypothetical protein